MKKVMLLLLGGVIFMTTMTGCSLTNKRMSRKKVENLFTDFISMFPIENYEKLYDKDGGTAELSVDDLGTWSIFTSLYMNENPIRHIGLYAAFNRNTRKCSATLYITKLINQKEVEFEYPVSYNGKFYLTKEVKDPEVKKAFDDFQMLFETLKIDKNYLSNLRSIRHSYNANVPLYGVDYKLDKDDLIIKQIKEQYPDLKMDDESLILSLEGDSKPWDARCGQSLMLDFDDKEINYFSAGLAFLPSNRFNDINGE